MAVPVAWMSASRGLASKEGNHRDEVSHEARAAGASGCSSEDLVAWLPAQGVLRNVRHSFLGLCTDEGQKVLAALMEADRVAMCGQGRAGCRVACGARRQHRQPDRAGRLAHRCAPTAGALEGDGELALPSFEWATSCDSLDAATRGPARFLTRRTTAWKASCPLEKRTRMSATSLEQPPA